ncbi:glycosyltransferase family 2 protein [Patescibacteria group bacterium]|nr:glycosyltransferase family 2 protein [Patescibacteria group bacterium]
MKLSLYIPCFNAEAYVEEALKGVFKQGLAPDEVIVIDDASTDRTVDIVSRYPVRLIRHTNNAGLASSRNTAIKNTNAEFIAALDADCIPKPDWLESLMKRFDSPKIAGVGGRLLEAHSSSVFDLWRRVHMKQYWIDEQTAPPFLFGSNAVFRRQALVKAGLYNEHLRNNYEDVDICKQLKQEEYTLIYEPKAIAHHLKRDNICSVLNTFWSWNAAYYRDRKYYSNQNNFSCKLKDNIGLANRYIGEDIASDKHELIYLDFLLALHHSLKDFEYFTSQAKQEYLSNPILSFWLSLLDLTLFYHLDFAKKNLSTLMPKINSFLQNFFALNLVLGRFIQERFNSKHFQEILYKHLLLSIYEISDYYLLNKLLNLIDLHPNWHQFCKKEHSNLNTLFLGELSSNFQKWLDGLMFAFPKIVKMIEVSAERTDYDNSIFRKEMSKK